MDNVPQFSVGGHRSVVCRGNVERLTATLVVVRNQHGNECKFRVKDAKQVGFAWPQLTHELEKSGK